MAFGAIALLGGVSSTANPSYTASELAYQLNDAGAKYLLTVPQLLERGLEAASQSKVESVFVFGNESQTLNLQKPLNEMGLNSLSNIDIKNQIDTEVGINLPIEVLLVGSNIY
ncbi:AMP-binding protein [Chroococcidiopsis sp. SAG 2025]|uniref:AMP-binding protein n=1 Tax=Chroococcidiopsis sp. SAG 2025 TaxID=171389 RepID=UPI002936E3D5|nr:AMP-binding protein [Chroococcidiopsis sp. SAG 2025]